VLGEGSAIVALLFEAFFVDETLVDAFDAVLVSQGLEDLVAQGRILEPNADNAVESLGKPTGSAIYSPFSLRQIIEFIFLLPLNLVPFVGVPLFLVLTGYRAGPFHHWRYFKLLGLSKKERKEYIRQRQLKYTWFGIVALILQLVPVLSMFFLLTTAAGSALWAAKMEKARRKRQAAPAQSIPEPYHDDPS
jgi:Etoposide-induced protein 2.4 (EI24)